jgi:hypothetical protein
MGLINLKTNLRENPYGEISITGSSYVATPTYGPNPPYIVTPIPGQNKEKILLPLLIQVLETL